MIGKYLLYKRELYKTMIKVEGTTQPFNDKKLGEKSGHSLFKTVF